MVLAKFHQRQRAVRVLVALLALFLAGSNYATVPSSLADQFAPAAASLDQFGGHLGLYDSATGATGYFRKAQLSSGGQMRWWLVSPFGNAYFANGVNLVTPDGLVDVEGNNPYRGAMYARYGNPIDSGAWAADVEDRLRAWGYNAVGSWSSSALFGKFPHTVELSPIRAAVTGVDPAGACAYPIICEESTPEWDAMYRRYFFDVFDTRWEEQARGHIVSTITSNGYAGSQNLIGYFADNEVPLWHGRSPNPASPWYINNTLADVFIALPRSAAGKQEWVRFLQGIYPNIGDLNAAWGGVNYALFDDLLDVTAVPSTNIYRQTDKLGFLQRIVGRYFSTIRDAIRFADPNHLYLGNRFVTGGVSTPYGVYVEAGKYLDVVSVNYYIWENLSYSQMKTQLDGVINTIHTQSGKPLLITEFSFAARDSGMPATNLNGALVETQEQRAQLYMDYRRIAAESPYVVGVYWWSYFDPPPAGNRVGRENSNLGLVDNSDNPYLRLLYRTSQPAVNAYAYRGLEAPSGPILSSARASVAYSSLSLGMSSLPARDPSSGTLAGASPGQVSSPLTNHHRLYLPIVTKNSQGLPQITFHFTLASGVASATIEIYNGNPAAATLKGTVSLPGPLPAGNRSHQWDGLDQNGIDVGTGPFFFVIKVATESGQKDYAVGSFAR